MYTAYIEEVTNGYIVTFFNEDKYVCSNRDEVKNLINNSLPLE